MAERFAFSPETLIKAYSLGVFPMAESADSCEIRFYDPDVRALIPLAWQARWSANSDHGAVRGELTVRWTHALSASIGRAPTSRSTSPPSESMIKVGMP